MREFSNVLRVDLRGFGWYLGALVVVMLVVGFLGRVGVVEGVLTPTGSVVFAFLFVHMIFTSRRPGYPLGVFELLPVRPRTVLLAHYTAAVALFVVAVAMHTVLLVVLERLGHALSEHWVESMTWMWGFGLLCLGVELAFHSSASSGRAALWVWGPVGILMLGLLVGSGFLWGAWGTWSLLAAGVLGIIISFLFTLPFVEREAR